MQNFINGGRLCKYLESLMHEMLVKLFVEKTKKEDKLQMREDAQKAARVLQKKPKIAPKA